MERFREQPLEEIKTKRARPEMSMDELESAYERANRSVAEHAIRPESFISKKGFEAKEVYRDLDYVDARNRTFIEEHNRPEYLLAKSLEVALHDRVNNDKWFGERVRMIMPSEFDDHKNGIDGIVEFQETEGPSNYLGLALDVTYKHNPAMKFEIIKEQIDRGTLGQVKYFRNSDKNIKRGLKNLPRTVVLMSRDDATKTVRDWNQNASETDSIMQKVILLQLEIQLTEFQSYAERLEKADPKREVVSTFYEGARRNVSKLLLDVAKPEDMEILNHHPLILETENQMQMFQELPEQDQLAV